jgi:hypothetical protein
MIVRNENQTLENFLSRCHRNISLIYNINNELMDKNKSLKEHGFYNNDKLRFTGGGMYYSGYFNENKFFNKVVLSDLIDEQKNNIFKIYSPSRMQHREIRENEDIQFDIIGSNIGAFLTPIGALAGIMFSSFVNEHEVKFSFLDFIKYGAIIAIPTISIALLMLDIMI